jgi:hypothetical protein
MLHKFEGVGKNHGVRLPSSFGSWGVNKYHQCKEHRRKLRIHKIQTIIQNSKENEKVLT